jgi:predicted Zn-dependent protease
LEWVRRLQPDLPEVLLGLAVCRFDAGEKVEAAGLLDHLLERQPDHPAGLAERGRLALCEGQPARAEELCRHALRVAHKNAVAWQVLALALESEGRSEESAQALDENCRIEGAGVRLRELSSRLEDEPNDPDLYVQIAAAYLTLDRAADAERALRQALVFDPSHANARQLLRELRRSTNMLTPSVPTQH